MSVEQAAQGGEDLLDLSHIFHQTSNPKLSPTQVGFVPGTKIQRGREEQVFMTERQLPESMMGENDCCQIGA